MREFFHAVAVSDTTVRLHHCGSNKTSGEKSRMLNAVFDHILDASPNKTAVVQSLISHLPNHLSKTNCARLEKQRRTHKRHSPVCNIGPRKLKRFV